jgi:hypothetical protein
MTPRSSVLRTSARRVRSAQGKISLRDAGDAGLAVRDCFEHAPTHGRIIAAPTRVIPAPTGAGGSQAGNGCARTTRSTLGRRSPRELSPGLSRRSRRARTHRHHARQSRSTQHWRHHRTPPRSSRTPCRRSQRPTRRRTTSQQLNPSVKRNGLSWFLFRGKVEHDGGVSIRARLRSVAPQH